MEGEKKYVPNDVFTYYIHLKSEIDSEKISVYVKPFPQPWDKDYDKSKEMTLEEKEDLVQEKYFSKERIAELKRRFIEKINSEENPFDICCVDYDGDYNVTEDELFKL